MLSEAVNPRGRRTNVHPIVTFEPKLVGQFVELLVSSEQGLRGIHLDSLNMEESRAAVIGFMGPDETLTLRREENCCLLMLLLAGVGKEIAPKHGTVYIPARFDTNVSKHLFQRFKLNHHIAPNAVFKGRTVGA
jgi:hypothetical protein